MKFRKKPVVIEAVEWTGKNLNGEYPPLSGSAFPPVLDACCGTRMMWFNKVDPRCLYVDKRCESFRPTGYKFADKDVHVLPDTQADFTALPFPDNTFAHVVFDPPHIVRMSIGNVTRYCGALRPDWRDMIRKGFAECFRVLRPEGVLVFKWSEIEIPVRDVLALTPEKPLYGHRSGKASKTHWIAFLKPNAESEALT